MTYSLSESIGNSEYTEVHSNRWEGLDWETYAFGAN